MLQVCIVRKRDTKQLYALKYMSKEKCIERKAVKNVLNELSILEALHHPFIVNLWFAFQDVEDLFFVVDLMLGGDLRFHVQKSGPFSEERTRLYAAEVMSALAYMHDRRIMHRDVKPDNILLDLEGERLCLAKENYIRSVSFTSSNRRTRASRRL